MPDARILMGNKYLESRLNAAKYNPALSTQAGAAEALDVDVQTVGRWERGATTPSNEAVREMSEVYRDLSLLQDYCAYACPIGCGMVHPSEKATLEQAAIGLFAQSRELEKTISALLLIAADGKIDESERDEFDRAMESLRGLKAKITSLERFYAQHGVMT